MSKELSYKNIDIKTFGELTIRSIGNESLTIIGDTLNIRSGAKVNLLINISSKSMICYCSNYLSIKTVSLNQLFIFSCFRGI